MAEEGGTSRSRRKWYTEIGVALGRAPEAAPEAAVAAPVVAIAATVLAPQAAVAAPRAPVAPVEEVAAPVSIPLARPQHKYEHH